MKVTNLYFGIMMPLCVFLVGPQSTGKTVMYNQLMAMFKSGTATGYSEIARHLLDEWDITGADLERDAQLYCDFQEALLERYAILQRDILSPEQRSVLLFDRSGIDPVVYSRLLKLPEADLSQTPHFHECLSLYRDPERCMIVLFPMVPKLLKADSVRMMPSTLEEYAHMFTEYSRLLRELDIPYYDLGNDLETLRGAASS